ncbi:MAG TPA: TIGR04282 family arsenosugar biosynthesis glycosyltransferase [Burkholderiales bacterium]|nr:TIGR04282 family arsenosugar biosynthesis glycosyltransferase [Burkholderiales bacterium]
MPRTNPDARLLVFTKAPRAGAVKTRLVSLLGEEGASSLQRRLIVHTLATARRAAIGALELHAAPDCDDAFLQSCAGRYGARLVAQVPGDLGTRMASAMSRALAESARAIAIGTDCPVLSARHLVAACNALSDNEAVLIPTEDGGYALIGLVQHEPRLFRDIEWGTERVMNQTRARLSELGRRWHEMETLWDVDRPEDYRRLEALTLMLES